MERRQKKADEKIQVARARPFDVSPRGSRFKALENVERHIMNLPKSNINKSFMAHIEFRLSHIGYGLNTNPATGNGNKFEVGWIMEYIEAFSLLLTNANRRQETS